MVSKYRKITMRQSNYLCHDEHNLCGVDDVVEIMPSRKLSRHKAFAVIDMVRRAPRLEGEPFVPCALVNPPWPALEEQVQARLEAHAATLREAASGAGFGDEGGGEGEEGAARGRGVAPAAAAAGLFGRFDVRPGATVSVGDTSMPQGSPPRR